MIRHVFLNARDEDTPDHGAIARVRAQRVPAKDNLGNATHCLSNLRFCQALEDYEFRCVEEEQVAENTGLAADKSTSNYSEHSYARGRPELRQDFASGSFDLLSVVYGNDY